MKLVASLGQGPETVEVTGTDGHYRVSLGGQEWRVDARLAGGGIGSLLIDGVSHVAQVVGGDGTYAIEISGQRYTLEIEEEARHLIRARSGGTAGDGGHTVRSPMPGRITHVPVSAGDRVAPGDTLVVVEAMKMENELKASVAGTVRDVRVQAGQAVNAGDVLVVVE